MARTPLATVVVPTLGRVDSLAGCLNALDGQSIADVLEVIVVHDGPIASGSVRSVTARPRTSLVETDVRRGPAAARNEGVRRAGSDAVLFTDDDCEPVPEWAEGLLERLRHGASVVAGPTVVPRNAGAIAAASQTVVEALASAGAVGDRLRFTPSSNLGCTAEVLMKVPFDERFPAAAGEDRDWCARCLAEGYEILLVPTAAVVHRARSSFAAFLSQHLRYGRGASRYRRTHGFRPESAPFYLRLVTTGFRRGVAVGALVCLAQLATLAGVMTERLGRHRAR